MTAKKRGQKAGRKPIYDTKIKPNLETIRLLSQSGLTQVRIREILGISKNTWEKYKAEKQEFLDALNARKSINAENHDEEVKMLAASMYRLALGFEVETTEYIKTRNGVEPVKKTVYYPPNFQALRFLLMNWGGYMSEPAAQAQREREFEHKKAMDEKNNW